MSDAEGPTFKGIMDRFDSHGADFEQINAMRDLRRALKDAAYCVIKKVPEGREQAIALTKLEEALFFANAGICRP